MREVARTLTREGTTTSLTDRMASFAERFELVGLSRFRELEARYRAP
ncbi:MAG TPA: hypothetical protein VJB36_04380 [Methylomirabilota bacterium]|nr:hypothetical protein [Methylomirabilota bacterium]